MYIAYRAAIDRALRAPATAPSAQLSDPARLVRRVPQVDGDVLRVVECVGEVELVLVVVQHLAVRRELGPQRGLVGRRRQAEDGHSATLRAQRQQRLGMKKMVMAMGVFTVYIIIYTVCT